MQSGLQYGLRSYFARPRKTNGVTANVTGGGKTPTPMENTAFFSPRVCNMVDLDGFVRQMPQSNLYNSQVPAGLANRSLRSPELWTRASRPAGRGRQMYGAQRASSNMVDHSGECPEPTVTLKARMSLESWKTLQLQPKEKHRIDKSVDKTPWEFRRRYSGIAGQDWVRHVDKLEVLRAIKFTWSAKEFYYGLQHTLAGKAREVHGAMEEDLISLDLGGMLAQ